MSDDIKSRLRGSCYLAFDDGTNDYGSAPEAADRIEQLEATERKLAKAVEELEWYAEQTRLCRLIHSEGDSGRHALQADGGEKARAVLAEIEKGGV